MQGSHLDELERRIEAEASTLRQLQQAVITQEELLRQLRKELELLRGSLDDKDDDKPDGQQALPL